MDGKIKRSRRSRSQRDRVRRRDAIDRNDRNCSPSSGSDRGKSSFRNKALCDDGKNDVCTDRPPRPPRRKRLGSVSQEDIIDGFAISSYLTLDYLEVALRKSTKSLRLHEGKEKWESALLTKRKTTTPEGAVIPANGFSDDGVDFTHEPDREKERRNVKSISKKNKKVKRLLGRHDRAEIPSPQRSLSRGHHSPSSFSGRGYSVSETETNTIFRLRTANDIGVEDKDEAKDEAKVCSSSGVSGLQRSQEQSQEQSVNLPVAAPKTDPPPADSLAPAAPRISTPPPVVCVKKERTSPHKPATPTLEPDLRQVKKEPLTQNQGPPIYIGLGRHKSSGTERSRKRTQPPSQRFGRHSSPSPALPLSVSELPAPPFFLPGHGHRRPAMFASPLGLPTNGIVGNSPGAGYTEHDLLRQELNNRFLAQTAERAAGAGPPMLRTEFHQHTHQHQHQHQLTFSPYPSGLPPAPGILSAASNMGRTAAVNFFPSYPPAMPGMPALHPQSGPTGTFSSLQGAFQPKSNPMDVATRPGEVPHTLLPKDPRKAGKWCAMHAQIAWQIHHHQQRMKHMHFEQHKMNMSGVKLDLFSRPAGPGLPSGFSYGHELARPLLASSGHLSASPYGTPAHHAHYLPASHLSDQFGRAGHYGNLGQLATNAFGGLSAPSIGPGSLFGGRPGHGMPGFVSPSQEAWNRLHRTPPSFPSSPALSRSANAECNPRVRSGDREREPKKRDYSATKDESDRDRNYLDRSCPSTHTPSGFQISNLIGSSSPSQAERRGSSPGSVQIKQRSSPVLEVQDRGSSNHYATPTNHQSSEATQTVKAPLNIKQERRDELDGPADPSLVFPAGHLQAPPPSPRRSHYTTVAMLQGSHLPHSLPLSMSPMHPVSSLSAMERARVQPFMEAGPLRDHRVPPHLTGHWDPLRDPYRGLYLQSQQGHMAYDPERGHRQRGQHPESHRQDRHRQDRHLQERHRQDRHLQAEERARLHQLQGSPMEGHLAHTPTFMSSLGGMMYPRLSPSAPHSGHLNRTPPTATLSAPPLPVPTSTTTAACRPATPLKTTPTSAPPAGDSSGKPKEVEAQ